MNKGLLFLMSLLFFVLATPLSQAGNPDRQGEAGAPELLMIPWARSAGLNGLNASMVSGVEAMRINIAGLGRINKTEAVIAHSRYLEGTGISMNALGIASRVGESGAFGLSLMALDFGDIPVTTDAMPEGTGATFSPSWFNLGLSYSYTFENKISVGILVRGVFESTAEISASSFALDAGVQYVSGPEDNFKFGISLRNIGSRMEFGGEALSSQLSSPTNDNPDRRNTFRVRTDDFELPSLLNIGLSYDFRFGDKNRLTVLGSFIANSFSRDEIGGGLEYALNEVFMLRGAYKYEVGGSANENGIQESIYTGVSFGASILAPLKKDSENKFGIDYAWRASNPFSGTHNISIRINL